MAEVLDYHHNLTSVGDNSRRHAVAAAGTETDTLRRAPRKPVVIGTAHLYILLA